MIPFADLHNSHDEETVLIVCNGPSLKDVPLQFLNKYLTFGFNNIFLLDGFTPTFYVACSPLVIVQSRERIEKLQCTKFIKAGYGITDAYELHDIDEPGRFSFRPDISYHEGHSVTNAALQLAYFMGFRNVLIVGLDHRFESPAPPDKMVFMEGSDPNHFSPDYFKGQLWFTPNLKKSAKAFDAAEHIYWLDGRRIINLTPNSALNVFEKGVIENW